MPPHLSPSALSAVYALAGPELAPVLLARFPRETEHLLKLNRGAASESVAPVPAAVTEAVIASRDPALLAALAPGARHRPGLFGRLAALGDPGLAVHLLRAATEKEQRVALWQGAAATAGHPGWRAPGGLVAKLLDRESREVQRELGSVAQLHPAELHSPFPELIREAMRRTHRAARPGHRATPADQLQGCRNGLRHGGLETLRELAGYDTLHPSVARRAAAACASPDPARVLGEDITAHEAAAVPFPADTLAARLRDPGAASTPESCALDWDALLAAHRESGFCVGGLEWLLQRPDCTEEFAVAALAAGARRESARVLYWSTLTEVDWPRPGHRREILARGVASGAYPVERVLRELTPAGEVLRGLAEASADDAPKGAAEPVKEAELEPLRAHVARLGGDLAAWTALYVLLPDFPGAVPELVDAALEQAPRYRGGVWPGRNEVEVSGGKVVRRVNVPAWTRCFTLAGAQVRHALGGYVDDPHVLGEMFRRTTDPALRDLLLRERSLPLLQGLPSYAGRLPSDAVGTLLALDAPAVNAELYARGDLTRAQRRRVCAGLRHGDGEAAPGGPRLPVGERVAGIVRRSEPRRLVLPALDSGDPELCRALLGNRHLRLYTDAANHRMLLRLGERHGVEGVRALLDEDEASGRRASGRRPLPPRVVKKVRTALETRPDPLGALWRLLTKAEQPAALASLLTSAAFRSDPAGALHVWEEETGIPAGMPWPELSAAQRRKPLDDRFLAAVGEMDGCPPGLAEAGAEARLRLTHAAYRPGKAARGTPPPAAGELLRRLPLRTGEFTPWLAEAYRTGRVTAAEALRHGFPAEACAASLARALTPPDEEDDAEGFRELAGAAAESVRVGMDADDPDAWTRVLRLMPGFEGTLPELLEHAGAEEPEPAG